MYIDKIREQIRNRSENQAASLDLFLKERTAILGAIADTHSFQTMTNEDNLARKLVVMNLRAGAFVDLGVIDHTGQQLAYVGPYELTGKNYYEQAWFGEVMSKGLYISDVYMGFRKLPHFIIAIRRQENQKSWILRATIDPDIFSRIVQAAHIGRTGQRLPGQRGGHPAEQAALRREHPRQGPGGRLSFRQTNDGLRTAGDRLPQAALCRSLA